MKRFLLSTVLVFMLYTIKDNNAPSVSILYPDGNESFGSDGKIPYKVRVTDEEDGDSKYDEIVPTEVLVIAQTMTSNNQTDAKNADLQSIDPGLLGIAASNCLYCHAFKGKLIGPSFFEMGMKYQSEPTQMEIIAQRVKKGSTGIWGSNVMPSHQELELAEIEEMLRWITGSAALKNRSYSHGYEGLLEIPEASCTRGGSGQVEILAVYRDHGSKDGDRKLGMDRVIVQLKE